MDGLLCSILRGDYPEWPPAGGEEIDREFLERSDHHGVQALIFDLVENAKAWEGWPDQVRIGLHDASRSAAVLDLLHGHALREILTAFAEKNIPVLIIKGGALASTLYEHSRLRARCDTDLFMHFQDIEKVQHALTALGFRIVPPIYKSHQFVAVKYWHAASVDIDIHWRILNAPQFARSISFEEAWDRSVPVPGIAGGRTMDEADTLLLACLHRQGSEFHDEDRLIWLYDIHLLGSSLASESWTNFVARAVDKRVQVPCLDGLLKSRDCFLTEIPPEVVRALEAVGTQPGRYAMSNLSLLIDDLQCLHGWRPRAGLLRELFVPSPGSLMEKYHKSNRAWLPLLYFRQILGGVARRLSLQ